MQNASLMLMQSDAEYALQPCLIVLCVRSALAALSPMPLVLYPSIVVFIVLHCSVMSMMLMQHVQLTVSFIHTAQA